MNSYSKGSMSTKEKAVSNSNQQGSGRFDNANGTEYRGVSVLMADLVGSTDLMEELGPEGYAELMRRFHTICNDHVRSRGGVVAQYQGDGIICYFGFPHAAEDDAVRAVEAAMDILDRLKGASSGPTLNTRIGISSGTVMIRADGDEFGGNAVGACINRASRLEALADANTVLICDDTRKLVGKLFQLKNLGPHRLKGFRNDENVFSVVRVHRGVATRFEALRGHHSGRLIGRDKELGCMLDLFRSSENQAGRSVVIAADAGIGKSRLVSAFLQSPDIGNAASFVLQCSPEHINTPLQPVSRYLEWVAGASPTDDDESRHNKLKRLLSKAWQTDDAETNTLLDLLSPLGAEGEVDHTESIPLRRRQALSLLADKIYASVAGRGAIVIVFEDVHWIDPSSAGLLEFIIAKAPDHHTLVVLTTRREPPFGEGIDGVELVELHPLSEEDSLALAQQVLAGTNLSEEQIRQVTIKGEGVPLFLEEYADILRNSVGSDLSDHKVPLTLAGLVQSKLDRLDQEARMFAQAGSALGRNFSPFVVEQIMGMEKGSAIGLTHALVDVKLALVQDSAPGEETLSFSHALIRDAIYSSMSGDSRRRLHNAIVGEFLALGGKMNVGEHVLAHHLAEAGRFAEAIERYSQAGMTAAGKGAAAEALAHLEAGLACVDHLPDSEERDRMELQLLAVRGPTQMVTRGPGNPDFGATQARAMDLVDRLGLHEAMVPVIYNTALHAWATADLERARTIAEAIAMIDRTAPSDSAYMAANTMQGLVAWHQGRNDDAVMALSNTVARHDPELHHDLYAVFLKEFGVFSLFYLGLTHSVLGEFDTGKDYAEKAFALAREMGFPHAHGFGLLARFNTAMMRGDVDVADAASAESFEFASRQGFPEFLAMSQFCQGWVKARRGGRESGVAEMTAGLEFWAATGFTCWQALFAGYLSRDLVALGRLEEADALLTRYIGLIDKTGENQPRALLLLAKAEMQEARGEGGASAATFTQARAIAEGQKARLWLSMIEDPSRV